MRSFIILFIILTGCQSVIDSFKANEKEAYADGVLHKVAAQLKEETGMRPIGTDGQMLHEIRKLGLSFFCYRPLDIVEGRKLLVHAIKAIEKEVNESPLIHPYLVETPFLPKRIRVSIFIYQPGGKDVPPGGLSIISAEDNKLRYKIDSLQKFGLTTIYEETYEEALARIADPTLPLVAYQPEPDRITPEEMARLRQGISFVGNDGAIWGLDANGNWAPVLPQSQSK